MTRLVAPVETEPPLRYLRIALLGQAVGLLALIGLTAPDWIDSRFRQVVCASICLDFRGLAFDLTALLAGPVVVLLVVLSWRWRRPGWWPLAIVGLIDAAAIVAAVALVVDFLHDRTDSVPPPAATPPLVLLPALATLVLGFNLVRQVAWKPILAVITTTCLMLGASVWVFTLRPVQQDIPGELALPFSRTTVYDGRDLGCRDYVQGWVDKHTCLSAALLVYRGSGDASKDQATINRVLAGRIGPTPVSALPVDVAVAPLDGGAVDPRNAGLCLIITDRQTTTPPAPQAGNCGTVTDYRDINSQWPGDDPYAIGIVYFWNRVDYVDQHSVSFVNGLSLSARPGQSVAVQVRAAAGTRCDITVIESSGQVVPGLGASSTDAGGVVAWTVSVEPGAGPGRWPITVTCGSATGRDSLTVLPG